MNKERILTLTGFMGCGKSSVGRELSAAAGLPFTDLDEYIERSQGRSIPEIFASEGETGFRRIESEALKSALQECRSGILALGGGALTTPGNVLLVKENTLCIYLRATVDTLVENLSDASEGRPMLSTEKPLREHIESLLKKREAAYIEAASYIIDTDGLTPQQIALSIQSELGMPVGGTGK